MTENEVLDHVTDESAAYSPKQVGAAPAASRALAQLRGLGKVGLFLVSLFLFILALTLMKEGARDLTPLIRDRFAVTNAVSSLGFGWLFAYVIMSGSPVAAGPASSSSSSASSTSCGGAIGPRS
jgi:hypothetical protein